MAKKTKAKRTAAGDGATKAGRKPNVWIEGFGAQQLVDYRKKHDISEAKLAKFLGTTLTSLRNWIGGKNSPFEKTQLAMKELLAKDYVAPPEGEKKPRGRPRKAATTPPSASSTTGMSQSISAARSAVGHNGDGLPVSSSAIAEVVAAYVKRLPADQPLTMDELEGHIARIKRALIGV